MKDELKDIMNEHRWFIMGLAMIAVVLFHQPWYDWGPFNFFHHTGFFGVEVFLFVSGWGIYHSLTKNSIRTFYKNRIVRMMPTCIFIGIMQAILCAMGWNNGVNHPLAYLLMCLGLFKWFVYAILCYYAVAPGVYKILRGNEYWFVVLLIAMIITCYVNRHFCFLESTSLLTVISSTIYRFPAFLFGMWMAQSQEVFNGFLKFGLIFLLFFTYFILYPCARHYEVINNSFLFTLSIPFILFIITKLLNHAPSVIYNHVTNIGKCSLEVFLWHEFYFRGIQLIESMNNGIQMLVSVFATIVSVFATRYFLNDLKISNILK